jgi:hypothetical protein
MNYIKRGRNDIFKIINTWSPTDISNLDGFLIKHLNEQMINEVLENVYDIQVYNELRDKLLEMTREYNILKEKINENNEEFLRLQQTRRDLIKETRRKKNKILKHNPDVKFTQKSVTFDPHIKFEESSVERDNLSVMCCLLILLLIIVYSSV